MDKDIQVVQERRSPLTSLTPLTLRACAALEREAKPGLSIWVGKTLFIRRGLAPDLVTRLWGEGFTTERRVA